MRARVARAVLGVVLTSVVSVVSCSGDESAGTPTAQGGAGEGGSDSGNGGGDQALGKAGERPSTGGGDTGQAGEVSVGGSAANGGAGVVTDGGTPNGVAGDGAAPVAGAGVGGDGSVEPPDLIVETGGPWPDSFTASCASPTKLIPCPQSDDDFFGQDGSYRINVPSYAATVSTVTDSVTGLVWQLKPASSTKTQADAVSYCAELSLAGQDDWRLPTRLEYVTLLDEGLPGGFAIPPVLPSDSSGVHWTQSATATSASSFFIVNDHFGVLTVASGGMFLARCVRGPTLSGTLSVGTDSTVDSMTSLEWQTTELEDTAVTWQAALAYCEGLEHAGKSDWRLPSIKELVTLIDETDSTAPVVDTAAFGDSSASSFWSSTPGASFSEEKVAFTLETGFGSTPSIKMTELSIARCVRSAD